MEYKYDRNLYLKSLFKSNVVYFETAMPTKGEPIKTLYKIKNIIAVTNYSLNAKYEEEKDYELIDGKLFIKDNGSIPQIDINELYLDEPSKVEIPIDLAKCKIKFDRPKFSFYGEGPIITDKQIAITYEHDDVWDGFVQEYQGNKVSKFMNKLLNKEPATILFFGDSITAGCSSSGTSYGGNIPPYAESWPVMIHKNLEERFNTKIIYVNTAVPGMNTQWALDNYEEKVNAYNPDLLVLAFGMNDGEEQEKHIDKIKRILDGVIKHNPDIEVLLIASTIANPETIWSGENKLHYIDEYSKLNMSNVAIVDMTSMHLSLLEKKNFRDLTGNNINHPNDFLARIYAQCVLGVIFKD